MTLFVIRELQMISFDDLTIKLLFGREYQVSKYEQNWGM